MNVINHIISDISSAKERIIKDLIQQVEGRQCVLDDAKNIIIAQQIGFMKELIIYKNIQLGYIEVDITETKMVVKFTPINTQNNDHAKHH